MKFLTRLAVHRGILGGNRFFTSIAIAIGLLRLLQRIGGTGPQKLYSHKLKSGETIVVTGPRSSR